VCTGCIFLKPRVFVDSFVKKCNTHLLNIAWIIGYRALSCEELEVGGDLGKSIDSPRVLQKIVISSSSVSEVRNTLARVNYKSMFVTVEPLSMEVARWSTHDTRVDTILITSRNTELFDKKQLGIMKYYSKPLEIPLPHLLGEDRAESALYRRIRLYASSRVPLVISSMATHWHELIHPYSLLKFLRLSYDIPERIGLLAVSDIPWFIISRKEGV
jgi:ribonuclease P/MRP protein subunit RPP1